MRSGMRSHRYTCHYELGLRVFISINTDKIKRGFLQSHTAYQSLQKPRRPRHPMPSHFLSFCYDYPVTSTSRTASLQFMLSISHP
jgi:hypothetical protein